MRKILFALMTLAACADDAGAPGGDDGTGGDGSGSGAGDGSGSGSGSGDDVSDAQKQQDYDDVAGVLGANLSGGDVRAMADAIAVAYGRVPDGFTFVDNGSTRVLEGMRDGLQLRYETFCRDAADTIIPCSETAKHGHVSLSYTGMVAGGSAQMNVVERSADWSVRDLAIAPRIGGKGTDELSATLSSGEYTLTVADTFDRVRFQSSGTAPQSGSIELVIDVERTRASASPANRTFAVNALLEFNGTQSAMLTLDSMNAYMVNLTTGVVTKH